MDTNKNQSKRQQNFRLDAPTRKALEFLSEKERRSQTQIIEFAVEEYFKDEVEPMFEGGVHSAQFQLDIYTWPACEGINPEIRTSIHNSPAEARSAVAEETTPYAFAVLMIRWRNGKVEPCDWEGRRVGVQKSWPRIEGVNSHHPAVVSLLADLKDMVEFIRVEHSRTHEPMIEIAERILKERHPDVHGWALHLAWKASE